MTKRVRQWAVGILGTVVFGVCAVQSADVLLTSSGRAPVVALDCGYTPGVFVNPCADIDTATIDDQRI